MRRMRQARKQKRAPGGQPVKAATCRGFRWSTRLSLRPVVAALCRGRRGLRLSLKELLPPVRETLSSIPLSGIGLSVLFRRYPVDPLSTKLTTKLATKFGGLLVGRNSSGLRRQPRRSFRSLSTKITTRLSIKFGGSLLSPGCEGNFVVNFVVNPAERDRSFRSLSSISSRSSLDQAHDKVWRVTRRQEFFGTSASIPLGGIVLFISLHPAPSHPSASRRGPRGPSFPS